MADCIEQIIDNIVSECSAQGAGGNEIKAWLLNRTQFSFTFDATNPSKITGIARGDDSYIAYSLTTSRKSINSGHDIVQEEGRGDRYTHFAGFPTYPKAAADVENIDGLGDLVVIVESRDKADDGNGTFKAYGIEFGLYKSSDTKRANDSYGVRALELTTLDGDTEQYSNYTIIDTDYDTTLALLEALETAVA